MQLWESLESEALMLFSNRYIERIMDLKAWESLENAAIILFSNRYIERIMDLNALREPRKCSF